jgi:hypothetical protein
MPPSSAMSSKLFGQPVAERLIVLPPMLQGGHIMAHAEVEYRRVVAFRLFDALCAHYPDRYVALTIPPRDVADDPDEVGEVMVRWPVSSTTD